ncbi:helix-turn-helix domain-containing protein [Ascidiimonas sp. W6]|uniref:helix-turn-helix domain-containing protein n=1 Tax=Ascidiimonas meishanensis TaxID=3128903 RepID=UPI0030EB9B7D
MRIRVITIIVFLYFVNIISSQNTEGERSLLSDYFEEIEKTVRESRDKQLRQKISNTYLLEAKKSGIPQAIANGYYLLANYGDQEVLAYADSLISASIDLDHFKFPAQGFLIKGNVYYEQANYKEALDQYLQSLYFASKRKNKVQYLKIKFNIGLLNNNIGNRKEALKIFKENISNIEESGLDKTDVPRYLRGLYALADSYTFNDKPDSSSIFVKKGIDIALRSGDKEMYGILVAHAGVNYFFLDNYQSAIDSLKKGKKILKAFNDSNKIRIAFCNYYIAKSLHKQGKIDESITYFTKVDKSLQQTQDMLPELIGTYNFLIAYSKSKNDIEGQIHYINQLIKMDSIKDVNYKYLSNTINKEYDAHLLIQEKEKLISKLEEDKTLKVKIILFLIVAVTILIIGIGYFLYRSNVYRKRFDELMVQINEGGKEENFIKVSENITKNNVSKYNSDDIGLSEEIVNEVLQKIEKFEKSAKFIEKQYTLNAMAKEIGTNSTYLSKIINVKKKTSFANYINNLRIDYAINQLTKSKVLRSYKIKAISEEFGFNTTQSFSNAFYKSTGIYPSYFLKQLNNQG